MTKALHIQKTFEFPCSASRLWEILTNPQLTKQYMYGCEVLSDWAIGSPILWQETTEDGAEIIYVKGEIQEYQAGKKVTFSMIDPNMGLPDIPENYVNLCYEVSGMEGGSTLKVTQGDFAAVANGAKRYEESVKGWDMVLPAMLALAAG